VSNNADSVLAAFRFRLRDIKMAAAEEAFKAAGRDFVAGSFIILAEGNSSGLRGEIERAAVDLGVPVVAVAEAPKVKSHDLAVPRIALVHNWTNTQTEGWIRLAFDNLGIPYAYISDQVVRATPDLRAKYDVILLGPTGDSAQDILNGLPMRGDPIPWKESELTPNIGTSPDQTGDIRGGLGLGGVINLKKFVEQGGLFVTIGSDASLPIDLGLIEGVSIVRTRELKARGGVYNAVVSDVRSPVAYGYSNGLAVYFNQAPVFRVRTTGSFDIRGPEASATRPSGRGSATDPDIPQGRPYVAPPPKPELKPGEEPPIPEDTLELIRPLLPPPAEQPRVILRFADEKNLLVAGMLAGGKELAGRPAVVDVPLGQGHVLLFASNPMWRQETQGSFALLFNAALNFDHLGTGQ
jgi:hypothetical protein